MTKNGGVELVGVAGHRDFVLLHGLQQRGLGLGRCAVDLVGQHDVGEDRPVDEAEAPLARGRVLVDDLGARDVAGHQVGRELDAGEPQLQGLGQRRDGERLGQARHADRQAVAAGERADEHLLDHLVLADDDLVDLGDERFAGLGDPANGFLGSHWGGDAGMKSSCSILPSASVSLYISG